MSRLFRLLAIILLVWASLIALTFALALILREIAIFEPLGSLGANVLRVGMGLALAIFWLAVWKKMADNYLWRSLRRR